MTFNSLKKFKLIFILLSMIPVLGCVSISYFFDVDEDASGKATIYHSMTFPETNDGGESAASNMDSYLEKLYSEGWEDIETTSAEDGRIRISALYHYDPSAGKNLPDSIKNLNLSVEEGENGETTYVFSGQYDYTQMKESWNNLMNTDSINLGPLMGGGDYVLSKGDVDAFVERYGEPTAETKVRLPGNKPLDAKGGWSNTADFLDGKTDTLVFTWTSSMEATGTLYAASQLSPEEPTENPASTEEAGQEWFVDNALIGMECDAYCTSLDPIGFWLEGETYPDCQCDCGKGNTFTQLKCVSNADLCSGEGMRLITDKDRPGVCMCTDPNKKYDLATQKCVPLTGNECNHGNGCEPEFGENCQNCSDCGCSFGSGENSQYNQYLTCSPENAKADIYGCVFEMPDQAAQLDIMKEEWNQCRDAWALMNLANGYGTTGYHSEVMNSIAELSKVQTWQQKSGCIATAGVVTGREAVDPIICLMRYCDRIKTGIHQLEQERQSNAPVVYGPSIKTDSPNVKVSIGALQIPYFSGTGSLYGNSPLSLQVSLGEGFVHSKYEIVSIPDGGLEVYLYEGSYTHTYFDTESGTLEQVELGPGEVLYLDSWGTLLDQTTFNPADREPWWEDQEYLVDCPENSTQQGADCYCNAGFVSNAELETCMAEDEVPSVQSDQAVQTNTNDNLTMRRTLRVSLYLLTSLILVIAFVFILVLRPK